MTTILIGMEKKTIIFHKIHGVDINSLHIKKMGTWLSKLIIINYLSSNIYIFPHLFWLAFPLLFKAPGKRLSIVPNENGIPLVRSQADILPDGTVPQRGHGDFVRFDRTTTTRFFCEATGGRFCWDFFGGWGKDFPGNFIFKKKTKHPKKRASWGMPCFFVSLKLCVWKKTLKLFF